MSAPYTKSQSKYGIGREATVGAAVAPGTGLLSTAGGVQLDEFINLLAGKEYEEGTKFAGKPFNIASTLLSKGKSPKSPTMAMNVNLSVLHALLGSIHYVGLVSGDNFRLYPRDGAYNPKYTLGDVISSQNERTLSFWHERETASGSGAGDDMVACLKGAVLNSLTLTFPMEGGPIKVGFDLLAFDHGYEEAEQSLAGYILPAAAYLDHVVDDFAFYYGDNGGTLTQVYPASDVVVNLNPVVSMEKRGTGKPRTAVIDQYNATFSLNLPWDSETDPMQADFDGTAGGGDGDQPILKELVISNCGAYATAPSAAGELRIEMHGRMAAEPTAEGDGIIRSAAEFRCEGNFLTSEPPYEFSVFDTIFT